MSLEDPVSKYIPAVASLRVAASHKAGADVVMPTQPVKTPLPLRHCLMFSSDIGGQGLLGSDMHKAVIEHSILGSNLGSVVETAKANEQFAVKSLALRGAMACLQM